MFRRRSDEEGGIIDDRKLSAIGRKSWRGGPFLRPHALSSPRSLAAPFALPFRSSPTDFQIDPAKYPNIPDIQYLRQRTEKNIHIVVGPLAQNIESNILSGGSLLSWILLFDRDSTRNWSRSPGMCVYFGEKIDRSKYRSRVILVGKIGGRKFASYVYRRVCVSARKSVICEPWQSRTRRNL